MDKKIAEQILATSMDCTREVNESVQRVMAKCDEETFKIYRGYGGRIMGYLFTEIIAPTQSEHLELAPPDFEAMAATELPPLKLTKEVQDELLQVLNRLYAQIDTMADVVREKCDTVETAVYRSRIHQVLVHLSEAIACILAARIVPG